MHRFSFYQESSAPVLILNCLLDPTFFTRTRDSARTIEPWELIEFRICM
jgi:hypothetical protein